MADVNAVTLTGTLERDPVLKSGDTGLMAGFTLRVEEANRTSGEVFKTFVPVETYGQACAQADGLHSGDAVLVTGKLKWTSWTDREGKKRSNLAVLGRLVKRMESHPEKEM